MEALHGPVPEGLPGARPQLLHLARAAARQPPRDRRRTHQREPLEGRVPQQLRDRRALPHGDDRVRVAPGGLPPDDRPRDLRRRAGRDPGLPRERCGSSFSDELRRPGVGHASADVPQDPEPRRSERHQGGRRHVARLLRGQVQEGSGQEVVEDDAGPPDRGGRADLPRGQDGRGQRLHQRRSRLATAPHRHPRREARQRRGSGLQHDEQELHRAGDDRHPHHDR